MGWPRSDSGSRTPPQAHGEGESEDEPGDGEFGPAGRSPIGLDRIADVEIVLIEMPPLIHDRHPRAGRDERVCEIDADVAPMRVPEVEMVNARREGRHLRSEPDLDRSLASHDRVHRRER